VRLNDAKRHRNNAVVYNSKIDAVAIWAAADTNSITTAVSSATHDTASVQVDFGWIGLILDQGYLSPRCPKAVCMGRSGSAHRFASDRWLLIFILVTATISFSLNSHEKT
jgi:hypothetical protein